MKIWRFTDQGDFEVDFAAASRVGTWSKQSDSPKSVRVKPLVIEWEPSSTQVGDFTMPSPADLMVKRTVADELLKEGFKGFEVGPVEMVPNREYKLGKRRDMIQLPYEGPELVDIYINHHVHANLERSTLKVKGHDKGRLVYGLEGHERIEPVKWDRMTGELERIHIPRTPGMGIYVDGSTLGGCDFFKVKEAWWILCTNRVREFILNQGYTNVALFEVGETVG